MRRAALFTALLIYAPAANAVEPVHCYLGEAPSDAPMSTAQPAPMSGYRTKLQAAAAIKGCAGEHTAAEIALAAQREAAGCSEVSEIAGYTQEFMSQPAEELLAGFSGQLGLDGEAQSAWCDAVEASCGNGDYGEACSKALANN